MIEIVLDLIFATMVSLMIAYVPVLLYLMVTAKPANKTRFNFRTAGIIFFVSLLSFSTLFIHGSLADKKAPPPIKHGKSFTKSPGR